MAWTWTPMAWVYLALVVAFAALFVGLLVYIARNARPSLRPAPAPAAPELAPGESAPLSKLLARDGGNPEPYLARFVYDASGEKVGETVGVHGEQLVLKRKGGFAAIPAQAVVLRDHELRVEGDVDWAAAEKAGEDWRRERHDALEYDSQGNAV